MFGRKAIPVAVSLVCAVSVHTAPAQAPIQDSVYENRLETKAVRKRRSALRRPKKDTPEEQLHYALDLRNNGKLRKAAQQYRALVHHWHESEQATYAQLAYAEILEGRRKYAQAFKEYQYLLDFYGSNYPYEDVIERQFRIAHTLMTDRRGEVLGFDGFLNPSRALPFLEQVIENAPNGKYSAVSQFYIGVIHEDAKDYVDAVSAYEMLLYRYPRSSHAANGAYRRTTALVELARRAANDEAAAEEAMAALAQFIRRFPEHEGIPQAQKSLADLRVRVSTKHYEIAEFYDHIAQRPEAALISYHYYVKRFPYTELATAAEKRIEALEAESTP
jgi:outer membrane protein assembly factor BamD (BamD/ComL family)